MIQKVCKKCGVEKPLLLFRVDSRKSDGRDTACKDCRAAQQKEKLRQLREMSPDEYEQRILAPARKREAKRREKASESGLRAIDIQIAYFGSREALNEYKRKQRAKKKAEQEARDPEAARAKKRAALEAATRRAIENLELAQRNLAKDVSPFFAKAWNAKLCCVCSEFRPRDQFSISRRSVDGLIPRCKPCDSQKSRDRRLMKRDAYIAAKRRYYNQNREKFSKWSKERKKRLTEEQKRSYRRKLNANPIYRIKSNIRKAIRDALTKRGYTMRSRLKDILGCDYEFFKAHIERQFSKGMAWDRMGSEIHIDHIVPLASAKTREDIIRLNHFTNLRPLWADHNLKKSDRREFLV